MISAKQITLALRGFWRGRYGIARCPAHDDRHPSLSLADGGGERLLAYCHAGCSFLDVLHALRWLGLVAGTSHHRPTAPDEWERVRREQEEWESRREAYALACWNEAVPMIGTIGETYLRHRGITCNPPATLRFHPDCWHPNGVRLPAMVARIEGSPRFSIHRTYLRPDGMGKADVEPAKAMLGAVAGGAAHLSGGGPLVVCEGIETGLSLGSGLLLRPATIWAALSTSGMKRLILPGPPGRITIATDGDDAGSEAGDDLATRATARGWKVGLLPAPRGQDWNDVLCMKGAAA